MIYNTPDGQVNFPDDMSEDQVLSVLRKKYGSPTDPQNLGKGPSQQAAAPTPALPGAQDTSALRYPRMAEQAINSGLAAVPNAAIEGMNLFNRATNPLLSSATEAAGYGPTPYHEILQINPITSDVVPSTTTEKIASGALSGTAAAAEMGGVGRAVYGGVKALGENIVPEIGRMGREIFNYGAVPGAAAAGTGVLLGDQSEGTKDLASLGTGALTAMLTHKFNPGNEFESIAARQGPSTASVADPADIPMVTGQKVQDIVRDWKANVLPAKLADAAAPLDAKMAHNPDVNLDQLDRTLNDMTTQAGKAQPLSDIITSRLPKQLVAALPRVGGPQITTPGGQTFTQPTIPYEDARQFRSDLGQLLSNPKLMPGTDIEKVKALYASISTDIGKTAQANGAGAEWKSFNEGSNALYKVAEGPMSKIVSDVNPSNDQIKPEKVVKPLLSSPSDLAALREHAPEAANELGAAMLRMSPEKWGKLPDASKASLVPNSWDRFALDNATPQRASPMTKLQHAVEPGVGLAIGEVGGEVANNILTALHQTAFIEPKLAGLITAGTPLTLRMAKELGSNPNQLSIPLRGAISGSSVNPLLNEEAKRQKER
jgi:hypothetical protein